MPAHRPRARWRRSWDASHARLDELLTESDVVSLHAPATPEIGSHDLRASTRGDEAPRRPRQHLARDACRLGGSRDGPHRGGPSARRAWTSTRASPRCRSTCWRRRAAFSSLTSAPRRRRRETRWRRSSRKRPSGLRRGRAAQPSGLGRPFRPSSVSRPKRSASLPGRLSTKLIGKGRNSLMGNRFSTIVNRLKGRADGRHGGPRTAARLALAAVAALAIGVGVTACGSAEAADSNAVDVVAYSTPETVYKDGIIPAFKKNVSGRERELYDLVRPLRRSVAGGRVGSARIGRPLLDPAGHAAAGRLGTGRLELGPELLQRVRPGLGGRVRRPPGQPQEHPGLE